MYVNSHIIVPRERERLSVWLLCCCCCCWCFCRGLYIWMIQWRVACTQNRDDDGTLNALKTGAITLATFIGSFNILDACTCIVVCIVVSCLRCRVIIFNQPTVKLHHKVRKWILHISSLVAYNKCGRDSTRSTTTIRHTCIIHYNMYCIVYILHALQNACITFGRSLWIWLQ